MNKLTSALRLALLPVFALASVSSHATTETMTPHWQKQQLANKASLRGSAAGRATLWVTGSSNSVFVSSDNGASWQDVSPKLEQSYDFRDIELLDDDTAIIMSAGTGAQSRLLLTNDRGKHWQALYNNPDAEGFFDSIAFWDQQQGMLLGDPVDGHFVLRLTKDQGKSWQRIPVGKLPKMQQGEAAFAASGNTLIVGKPGQVFFTTGGNSAQVYRSDDYGQHWQKQTLALHQQTATAGGYALALNSTQQPFVLGGDYQQRDGQYANMVRWQDNQWQLVDNGQHGLRTAMACVGTTCVATGKLSSDISYDDGASWQPFAGAGYYTLASNDKLIVAAGADGQVAVLTLAGQ